MSGGVLEARRYTLCRPPMRNLTASPSAVRNQLTEALQQQQGLFINQYNVLLVTVSFGASPHASNAHGLNVSLGLMQYAFQTPAVRGFV